MHYLILVIGLLILVKGADVLVDSASKIAKHLNISSFIIGLFIVAMGTSAPEASIGIISGIQGTNLITLGDVIGSSIVNITVVIGVIAIISPIEVDPRLPGRELLISIFVQVCLLIMILTNYTLSRMEGVTLLFGMLLFSGYVYTKSKNSSENGMSSIKPRDEHSNDAGTDESSSLEFEDKIKKAKRDTMPKLVILFLIGLAGLIGGANLSVNSAVQIAHNLGLSETFIGLTVIALGTSLPELVTCLIAVFKKEEAIAVGNVIGSNIFNVLFVLGMSGALHPITVTSDIFFDIISMIGASILFFISVFFFGRISRNIGIIYFAFYLIYLAIKLNGLA